jgi:hypothetical protein
VEFRPQLPAWNKISPFLLDLEFSAILNFLTAGEKVLNNGKSWVGSAFQDKSQNIPTFSQFPCKNCTSRAQNRAEIQL